MSLIKLAFLTAILGISLLLFLSNSLEPAVMKISDINDNMLKQYVKINGNITSFKTYENLAVFSLEDESGNIPVVIYNLKGNLTGSVEVIGMVKEYKGKLEVEASKIKIA